MFSAYLISKRWDLSRRLALVPGLRFVTTALLFAASAQIGFAQARPTATQDLRISAFGGVSGIYTGLEGGKNLGITVGADLGLRTFFRFAPTLEVRGTYPFSKGTIDNQKNILGGIKVSRTYAERFHPYANFLIGRGQIVYSPNALPDPTFTVLYLSNPSTVFSPGGGLDFDLNDRLALKADAQYQRYSTPVTTSGTIYAKSFTAAVIYRFNFAPRRRRSKP